MDNPTPSDSFETFHFGQTLISDAKTLKKRDRTQAQLYNASCDLLNSTPLSLLKVSQICQKAGVAHGTFYIYFPSRQDFVASLLLRFVQYLQTTMHQPSIPDETNTVRTTTSAYYQLFAQNTGLMKCLINHHDEFPGSLEAFQKLNREWATIVVDASERKLAEAGRAGKVSRNELFRRAYALGGMVDQYLSALLLDQDPTLAKVSENNQKVIETLSLIWERSMTE